MAASSGRKTKHRQSNKPIHFVSLVRSARLPKDTEKERDDIGYASHGGYRTHVCRIPIGSGIRRPKVHHVPLQPRSHLPA
jgi:hypothetical protein